MSDADFARVSPHHIYTRQVAHGLFVPPANGTGPQIAAAQAVHDEALSLFNECTMVEKILITQMRNTIEPKYFKEQLHATTRLPIGDIATILSNLYTTYGTVTQTHLEQERVALVAMDYQMSEPIETIYKAITDYGSMCTSEKVPLTDLQFIGVGLVIFNKSNLMTKFVTKWEKKDLALKNLATFKIHFSAAHRDVRSEASSATAGDFGHHANSVLEAMMSQEQKAA